MRYGQRCEAKVHGMLVLRSLIWVPFEMWASVTISISDSHFRRLLAVA